MTNYVPGPVTVIGQSTKVVYRVDVKNLTGGGYVVTYQTTSPVGEAGDTIIQVFDDNGVKVAPETTIPVSGLTYHRFKSDLALDDGGFVVMWWDGFSGNRTVQRFDSSGTPVGSHIDIPDTLVESIGDGFIGVSLQAEANGVPHLFYQAYEPLFQPVGAHVQIEDNPAYTKRFDGVVRLEGGGTVFVYDGIQIGGVHLGLYVQQFDSTGLKMGPESRVDATNPSVLYADVAALKDGGYVIAWTTLDPTHTSDRVISQRYDASGHAVGPQVQSPVGSSFAYDPSVDALDDGGYVIAWRVEGDNVSGLYTQRFDAAGNKTEVSKLMSGEGFWFNVSTLDSGGYVVEWTKTDYDTNASVVYQEVFTAYDTAPVYGDANDNVLYGTADAGILMYGLAGNDTYMIDDKYDQAIETAGGIDTGGTDTVRASIDFTLGDFLENLVLTGSAGLHGIGNALDNRLEGNSGANLLDGAGGADRMYGLAGNDSYYVDAAGDRVDEKGHDGNDAGGHDTVFASVNFTLGQYVEALQLTGTANLHGTGNDLDNRLVGNDGRNVLSGLAGNDSISGGAGSDVIIGGAGNDTLYGGGGHDRFVFGKAGMDNGHDRLLDFHPGQDRLEFSGADYGFTAGHVLEDSELSLTGSAIGPAAQFVFDPVSRTLFWDENGDTAGGAQAIVNIGLAPYAGDFWFT